MPGDSGVTVTTCVRATLTFARKTAGASGARHSLRPLIREGGKFRINLAQNMRRDREAVFANEEGDTITLVMPGLDPGIHRSSQKALSRKGWIAGSSPAMTGSVKVRAPHPRGVTFVGQMVIGQPTRSLPPTAVPKPAR